MSTRLCQAEVSARDVHRAVIPASSAKKRRGHGKKRRKQRIGAAADTPVLAVGAEVAVELLGWHTPAAEPLAQAGRWQDKNSTPCMLHPQFDAFPYVLVMPPMGVSLHDACKVAGRDLAMVLSALQQVVRRVRAERRVLGIAPPPLLQRGRGGQRFGAHRDVHLHM